MSFLSDQTAKGLLELESQHLVVVVNIDDEEHFFPSFILNYFFSTNVCICFS